MRRFARVVGDYLGDLRRVRVSGGVTGERLGVGAAGEVTLVSSHVALSSWAAVPFVRLTQDERVRKKGKQDGTVPACV